MHDLGILFQYHLHDPLTAHNLATLTRANPGVPIIPICAGPGSERVPGAVQAAECGALGERWLAHAANSALRWRNCDLPYLAWYSSSLRTISCRRWILLEYDVFCTMRLLDFIAPTLHADVIAPTIPMPGREPGWHWFAEIPLLPPHLRPFANGLVPLVTTILSDAAMAQISNFYLENELEAFCELRLGTIANHLGFQAVPNSHPAARNISWRGPTVTSAEASVWHPVKAIAGSS